MMGTQIDTQMELERYDSLVGIREDNHVQGRYLIAEHGSHGCRISYVESADGRNYGEEVIIWKK